MPRLDATLIGHAATAWLRPGAYGTVLAKFQRSGYLRLNDDTQLICLASDELPAGPITVLCRGRPAGFAAGAGWFCDGRQLQLNELTVVLTPAAGWRPPTPRLDRPGLRRGLTRYTVIERSQPAKEQPDRDDFRSGRFAAVAGDAIAALDDWLQDCRRQTAPSPAATRLIGLGHGLTPAGDDYLSGLLLALRFARHPAADRLADWALATAATATGAISIAHLRQAAAGQAGAALHAALTALNRGGAGLEAALADLDRVGHSSGRDALAGLLHGLRLALAYYTDQQPGERSC